MTAKPRIRIFRPGRFTSSEGEDLHFSADDLAAAASAYDPAADPAPLVVGHPRLDAPAFGWVESLKFEDGELVAVPGRIEPAFAEAVREGRYARVSASFYPPQHPRNPAPGNWYLKHVGFLGAAAPAVKGLGTVAFGEDDMAGAVTIFSPNPETSMTDKTKEQEASFAERQAVLDAREAAIAEGEARIAAGRARIEAEAAAARHEAHVAFAEALISSARLAPAGKALVVGLLDTLALEATASFGEAGELSPADAFRKLFDGARPLVDLGEAAPADQAAGKTVSFAAPAGYTVDPEAAALHARVTELRQAHPELSLIDAVRRAHGA